MGHPRFVGELTKGTGKNNADPSLRLKYGYVQDDTAIFLWENRDGESERECCPTLAAKESRKDGARRYCSLT